MNTFSIQGTIIKISLFAAILAAAALLTGSLWFRDKVFINDNGDVRIVRTNETDVYRILNDEKYVIGENDAVTVENNEDENEMYVTIQRAFEFFVNIDGEKRSVSTYSGTVEEALSRTGIVLGEYDTVNPPFESEIYPGMEINVIRINYTEREEVFTIPFETQYIDNSNLAVGYTNTLTEGKNGVKTVKIKEKYIDGRLVSSENISEDISSEPITAVVERGTAFAVPYAKMSDPTAVKLVNGIPENYTRIVSGKATAYSARAGAKTASGRYAVVGTVAVNPNVIPYGSELYIVSQDRKLVYGYAIAADTGLGMMEGTVAVDLFMGSYADSCKWGAHQVDIFVLSEGNG